jgi:hypothetical protein
MLGEVGLTEARAPELTFGQLFRGFILWLEVVRQNHVKGRLEAKYAAENLRRVLDEGKSHTAPEDKG